jgi:hypothetical protein
MTISVAAPAGVMSIDPSSVSPMVPSECGRAKSMELSGTAIAPPVVAICSRHSIADLPLQGLQAAQIGAWSADRRYGSSESRST